MLPDLAGNLIWCAEANYIRPPTFLGIGGMKVFREDIWGRLRAVFQADHRAHRPMGFYDFPQNDWRIRLPNVVTTGLLRLPGFRREFARRIKSQMVQPYQKIGGP